MSSEFDLIEEAIAHVKREIATNPAKAKRILDALAMLVADMHGMAHEIAQGHAVFDYQGHKVVNLPKTDHFLSLYRPTAYDLLRLEEALK